ncbi:hypothetical protein BDZ91DRAFT_367367 [Kalaharituber pfeilii]|nr:hypothetical protein BDZ91DRAFT_367367 [Kalaharituber pfeilii]
MERCICMLRPIPLSPSNYPAHLFNLVQFAIGESYELYDSHRTDGNTAWWYPEGCCNKRNKNEKAYAPFRTIISNDCYGRGRRPAVSLSRHPTTPASPLLPTTPSNCPVRLFLQQLLQEPLRRFCQQPLPPPSSSSSGSLSSGLITHSSFLSYRKLLFGRSTGVRGLTCLYMGL